ncbi:MAG: hypothetical protein ACODAD_11665 [Planctomycetota bacterium]
MPALRVNAAAVPEPGLAVTHKEVRGLDVKLSDCWITADTQREYEALVDRLGTTWRGGTV